MESKPMDRRSEELLIKAAKQVMAFVESDGDHPNDAIVKTAEELKVGREMIPLLVNTYNIGRTSFQQNHGGSSILSKQASFPIAHLETIVDRLYPANPPTPAQQKMATIVHDCYFRPPSGPPPDEVAFMEKVAEFDLSSLGVSKEVFNGEPRPRVEQAFSVADQCKRAVTNARGKVTTARDNYLAALGAIAGYFKEASAWRKSFAEVQWAAERHFGDPASHALDYAYTQAGLKEAHATGPPSLLRAVDYNTAPYTLIKHAIECGKLVLAAQREKVDLDKQADTEVKEAFRPFAPTPEKSSSASRRGSILSGESADQSWAEEKEAGFLTNMAAVGIGGKMKGMSDSPSSSDMVDDVASQLNSPDHLSQLQQIQTRAMLADLVQNDEVISGFEPEEVFSAYNELAQMSPRAANQPMVVRPILRRRLTQGGMEPFEAQQVADLEKTVGQTENPPQQQATKTSEVLRDNPLLR